ncbi:DNA-dependent DNA polymerase family X protein [Corchorus olitorius]|uniref:DNA-dependent DNA polymerase family X protein n=1 Tax=Corchorus olitorius TaxID=93759 RepID=A0A1R3HBK3_9ROSI|nr:DNA-dependent DNA polymerase family X protein [Corchorus olitorius]
MYGREVARVHNCTFQHLSAIYDSVLRGGGVVVSKSCADFLSNTTIPAPPDSNSAYKIIENMGEITTVTISRAYVPYVTAVKDLVAGSAAHCGNDFVGQLKSIVNVCLGPRSPFRYI